MNIGIKPSTLIAVAVGLSATTLSMSGFAADLDLALTLKDHRFEPSEIKVPANQRVRLSVHNQDNSAEEFESKSLKREKVIPAGAKAAILIGPLKPGRYEFFGEFHEATARGVVVAE
jgi:hypothetical protein